MAQRLKTDWILLFTIAALVVFGLAIVTSQLQQGPWLFALMAPAYNHTLGLFFGGLVIIALLGDRIEAWRAAFCFVGTLLTTCMIAIILPARGLGVWAPQDMIDRLPAHAMRNFWPHFDDFYFGAETALFEEHLGDADAL